MQKSSDQSLLEYDYSGLRKVISGGQCGADQGGLVAAYELNVPTGGWAPKGWRTAEGPAPELQFFGLKEHYSEDYVPRTKLNVQMADATIIVASNLDSAGSRLTISSCLKGGKPFYTLTPNFTEEHLAEMLSWFLLSRVCILNVAGNRDYSTGLNPAKHFDAAKKAISWLLVNLDDKGLLKRKDINTESNHQQ